MKRFFVAAFCTLLMSGSLLAQDTATNVAPVVPVEDVAAATTGSVEASTIVSPQVAGCSTCGSVVAPVYAPMTYTTAPQGCSSCGTAATSVAYTTAVPMQDAPVASDCGCGAPVASGCGCDPCANQRVGFMAKRRARVASRRAGRNSCDTCCY